jgi:cullin-associated NEDD8-dissociated protein 1
MTASGTASVIGGLLEKTKDYDKDERYMATSDLCNELQKDIKLDANMERRICTSVLKQLDDSSNDVQSIAVKCLGILLAKVGEPQVKEISDKLAGLVLDGKSELRDIYSIGLKTLVADVPDAAGCAVAPVLAMQLLGGIKQDATVQIKLDCLDITTDLIKRFGRQIESDHEEVSHRRHGLAPSLGWYFLALLLVYHSLL